jgi:hypothetical protein
MTVLKRYRVAINGGPVVGPGLATFYESPESGVGGADAIEAFYDALKGAIPDGLQFSVPSSGDLITAETGDLVGAWSDPGTGGVVSATGGSAFVNGVGARIVWNTAGVFSGRRVRGSTFIVPLVSAVYEGAGNINSGNITLLQNAANALVAALDNFAIWSRPNNLAGDNGEANQVTSATVPDKVSWLRGRRT